MSNKFENAMEKSRAEQEKQLTEKYLNQVISYQKPKGGTLVGKVNRISFWPKKGEELVQFEVGSKMYDCDLDYFEENTIIL